MDTIPAVAAPRDLSVYKRGTYKGFPEHIKAKLWGGSYMSVPTDPAKVPDIKEKVDART